MKRTWSRREVLRAGITGAGALIAAPALTKLPETAPPRPSAGPEARSLREVKLVAEAADVDFGPLGHKRLWIYNGRYPGPEIRVAAGERLRITFENRLPEKSTIHWHGVPVPNAMDGVPEVTQEPVPPGGRFVYGFDADPAGTFMYHSHQGLQLDRGLFGPLVFEEKEAHVEYDRDYALVLDDLLPGAPRPLDEENRGGGMMRGRMMGGGMMGRGMMGGGGMRRMLGMPEYEAFLMNGHPAGDPAVLDVSRGERIRLRMVNSSAATLFRVAIAEHRMLVTHADSRPVSPVEVDALWIGSGERYDVIVRADNPGSWPIFAVPAEGGPQPARAILRYRGTRSRLVDGDPEDISEGRVLELEDLVALERVARRAADREFDLTLSGGMMSSRWTIDGEAYPDASPLDIHGGERVRVQMSNMSMMTHPMHLHGHFFEVGSARKDTVLVPPHMGRVTFEFTASNPGDWMFHCHNLYHMEAGMARVLRYV